MGRWTQLLTVLLAVVLLSSMAGGRFRIVNASSAAGAEQEKPESEMTEEEKAAKAEKDAQEKKLKEVYELPVQTNELKGWPEGPGTYGDAAIVMDADSGAILYAKNIDKSEYPASITKVLTALLAFEYGDMQSQVTISQEALECLGSGYASIGLKAGNVISMEQALYAMLLASANEAAYAVGEKIAADQGQSYDWFLTQMNDTCEQLGGVNSNFVNTNGVFDENHHTCARDMALIGSKLFDYPEFFQICQTQQYSIPASDTVEEHVFQQKHRMLIQGNKDCYEYVVGGKTGYTTEAENTLITMADNGQMRLVCVVLKTYSGHPYSDTRALLEYGFDHFQKVSVSEHNENKDFESFEEGAYVMLPEGVDFDSLEWEAELNEDGENDATVTYYYKDMPVGACQVTVSKEYRDKGITFGSIEEKGDSEAAEEENGSGNKVWIALGIAAVILIVTIVYMVMANISRRRRRKRHRRRRR